MEQLPIYLDYHATTPVDPRVVEVMTPYFTDRFGNAASRHHAFGWAARDAVEAARRQVARLIGADPREICFTSGATESNNLALKGAAAAAAGRPPHMVTVATEHRAVLDPCRRLAEGGARVTEVEPGPDGLVSPDVIARALTADTVLVSVMLANNEIGVLQPIPEIAALTRSRGILLHSDAAQAAGRVPVDVEALGVDLLSLTAHKLYGPKGVGALYVRRRRPRLPLAPLIDGGGHERGLRSGTLNVPGIVGFGAAAEICKAELEPEAARIGALRDRLLAALRGRLDGVTVNGSLEQRLPHNLNVSFDGVEGESLLVGLDDVAVSSGAACSSASPSLDPSHVLRAIGIPDEIARASLRFGLGRWTTAEEIDYAADKVGSLVTRLRQLSPARAS
ncbi:MAG: IscS subfamily cysteine desulfurase [Acidobacteria bacterium]|nr:IscS subfamily cysteine desulfurase [Acidobacteriota bacterium]